MTPIIILAAGASTRLGRAKQTLFYNGKTLLHRATDAAINAGLGPVVIVVGANEQQIRADVGNYETVIVTNENWRVGMASSIKEGLRFVMKLAEDVESIILMVCDQPYVDEYLLRTLVNTKNSSNKSIVACSYKDTVGVPALFDKIHFSELLALQADEGGKKVLLKHHDTLAAVPFPAGEIDIDTEADYEALAINGPRF